MHPDPKSGAALLLTLRGSSIDLSCGAWAPGAPPHHATPLRQRCRVMLIAVVGIDEPDASDEPRQDILRRRILFGVVLLAVVAAFVRNIDKLVG